MKATKKILRSMEGRTGVALLVIDVQQGLFKKSTPIYNAEALLQNINTLAEHAHTAGVPVFYIQHSDKRSLVEGSDDWQLHAELRPLDRDVLLMKTHPNAFEETALDEALEFRNIGRLVVAGLVTHGCVRATCQGARELGYAVTLVKDAHSSFSKDAAHLIEECHGKLSAAGVELKTTSELAF